MGDGGYISKPVKIYQQLYMCNARNKRTLSHVLNERYR